MTMRATQVHRAVLTVGFAVAGTVAPAVAAAHPSEPGVVNYAVLGKGSVGNIVGGPMGWESVFTQPGQGPLGGPPGVQQLGGHRAVRGLRRSRSGVVQRGRHADVGE
ncbi:hypothetical protein MINTMi198_03550 [Mycobacterium intracellulare M.i.198]|nr:hypothetical protein MINTMi198_03550 [Mycobacterium intracellulare M.i.198]